MNTHRSPLTTILAVAVVAGSLLTFGCASAQKSWGDLESGLNLAYRMPTKESLSYRTYFGHEQTIDMMGRSMTFTAKRDGELSVRSAGVQDGNHALTITVDAMTLDLDTPRGDFNRVLQEMLGQSFELALSPQGEEVSVSGADKLQYSLLSGGTQNMTSDFEAFFPDLASGPIRVGESWESSDTIHDINFNGTTTTTLQTSSTLVGLEVVDGVECAQIKSSITGVLTGEGTYAAKPLSINGTLRGSAVTYFDYRRGVLVKTALTSQIRGRMTTGEQRGVDAAISEQRTLTVRLLD